MACITQGSEERGLEGQLNSDAMLRQPKLKSHTREGEQEVISLILIFYPTRLYIYYKLLNILRAHCAEL